MENRKNTEQKTVIKNPKNDGCFFTPSLRKSHTSIHTKQNHKNLQTLATTTKTQARRAERIRWNRQIVENYLCNENCVECDRVFYFEQYYKNRVLAYFLFKDVRFLVIIEKREEYNLLITGFYIEYENAMKKYIKKYETYKKQKTPLI